MSIRNLISSLLLVLFAAITAMSQTNQPFLRLNTEMHTSMIRRVSADAKGTIVLTCSDDKTAKLWDNANGKLIRTFRTPIQAGNEGMLYACALTPDGKMALLGGYTGTTWNNNIYIYSTATGEMIQRLTGLESLIVDLEVSVNGKYLAVALNKGNGVRIFEWSESKGTFDAFAKLDGYGSDCYNLCFDNAGRLATICIDGYLRLYDNQFKKTGEVKTGGKNPISLAFSPDGSKIAVGFNNSAAIEVYDGWNLKLLYKPDVSKAENRFNNFSVVSFSADGSFLFGGGYYHVYDKDSVLWAPVRRWENAGKGGFVDFNAGQSSVNDIKPLPDNSIVFCSSRPDFGRMKADGTIVYYKLSDINSYSSEDEKNLKINKPGDEIGITPVGKPPLHFSVKNKQLSTDTSGFPGMKSCSDHRGTMFITDWLDDTVPKLNGRRLKFLQPLERARSVDISTDTASIVFGANWYIYCLDSKGEKKWETPTQSAAWSVSISGDNRSVVAAMNDGTIRWYRMSDGALLLTLFAHSDNKHWILYTANGYFISSEGGDDLIGWHINNGLDKAASFYPAKNYADQFFRPDIVSEVLAKCETDVEILKWKGEQKTEISKKPPLVKIISPSNNTVTDKGQIIVTMEVTDQGGGIDQVLLYVNGKLVQATPRGIVIVGEPISGNARTFNITLTSGVNRIRATAFNEVRMEAIPDEIGVTCNGAKAAPNLYIMVAGVNQYKNPAYRLNYAVADAMGFKTSMENGTKSIFSKVETIFLQDANVTRKSIMEKFTELKEKVRQEDVFIFYYAGHGVMSEGQNPQFYIVPYDVTQLISTNLEMQNIAVSAGELQAFSKDLKAQKQLFVFDACQSGGLVEEFAMRGAIEERAIAQLARSTGTYWITASGSQQFASEFAQLGHGLFTYTILKGLEGAADSNGDKKITVEELLSYVKNKLPEFSEQYKGVAQYPNSFGYGMDFPLFIIK